MNVYIVKVGMIKMIVELCLAYVWWSELWGALYSMDGYFASAYGILLFVFTHIDNQFVNRSYFYLKHRNLRRYW